MDAPILPHCSPPSFPSPGQGSVDGTCRWYQHILTTGSEQSQQNKTTGPFTCHGRLKDYAYWYRAQQTDAWSRLLPGREEGRTLQLVALCSTVVSSESNHESIRCRE